MVSLAVQYSGNRRRYQRLTHSHFVHLLCGLNVVDTHYQVCSILWSTCYKAFISGHGFAQNKMAVCKYATMAKVAELKGHTAWVMSLTMSPDGATVASAAANETLWLWHCFELDPAL